MSQNCYEVSMLTWWTYFKHKKLLLVFLEYSKFSPYVSVPVKMGQIKMDFIHHLLAQKAGRWKDLSLSILKSSHNQPGGPRDRSVLIHLRSWERPVRWLEGAICVVLWWYAFPRMVVCSSCAQRCTLLESHLWSWKIV